MSTPVFLYETNRRFEMTPNLDSGRSPCVDSKSMITYVFDLQIIRVSFILLLASARVVSHRKIRNKTMSNMNHLEESTPRPSSDDREISTLIPPTATSSATKWLCHRPQRSTVLITCQVAALALLFFLIGKFAAISITSNTRTPTPQHCGQTITEAKARDCIFNPMTYSWELRLCHNDELTAEFLRVQDWQWYLDSKSQREVDRDLVLAGTYEMLYVTWDYRRHQCVFAWRKLHKAAMEGKQPDRYTTDWSRNMWCEEMLAMHNVPLNSTDTFLRQGFSTCGLGM